MSPSNPSVSSLNDLSELCEDYAQIKAYQYKLLKFFTNQNLPNTTTVSIMYLLQSAAESLQAIQVSCSYCIRTWMAYYDHYTVQQPSKILQ